MFRLGKTLLAERAYIRLADDSIVVKISGTLFEETVRAGSQDG